MEGCSAPVVVKFADTQREKDQKKMQQIQANICGLTSIGSGATIPATPSANGLTTALLQPHQSLTARTNPSMAAALMATSPQQSASSATLVPTTTPISASPSILAATNHPQQAAQYMTTDALTSATQLQLFQQLQAFGLHPAQYLQGKSRVRCRHFGNVSYQS